MALRLLLLSPVLFVLLSSGVFSQTTSGSFLNTDGEEVLWTCGQSSSPGEDWKNQGSGCYHKMKDQASESGSF